MEQAVQTAADRQIHNPEIECKQEHGDDDNCRRGLHFLARRRADLPHLRAHVVVKTLDALRPGPQRRRDRVLFYRCRHTFPLSSTVTLFNLAGAEGFEPPSSVLETDSLTVELTPLCSAGALARVSLLHFPVRLVPAATGAELLQFDAVRRRLAVLGG